MRGNISQASCSYATGWSGPAGCFTTAFRPARRRRLTFGVVLKQLGGPLEFLNGRISDATIELFDGAAVTSRGVLECLGGVRFTVSGGAPPTLTNRGTLRILAGTTLFDGAYFLGRGTADVADGATLVLSGLSVMHLLSRSASVTGPGTLRVTGDSSLFVEQGAVFTRESVLDFTRGNLASKHQGDMAQSVLGPLGDQLLSTGGTLRWNEGVVYGALRINKGGTLEISGSGAKGVAGGSIDALAATAIDSTEIDLTEDARFTNQGSVAAVGDVRLSWPSGGTPFFISPGVLTVAGRMTVWDVVGLIDGVVEIAAGATLVLQCQTAPSFLLGKARVRGGGTLRVTEGRLHAVSTARIEHGTTFELAQGGSVTPPTTPIPVPAATPLPAQAPARQGLVIEGLFHWTGGTIYGDVTVGKQGVLSAEGPDVHGHAAGVLRLSGSGALVGPARLEVEQGMLLNEADLLIQGPIEISTGSTWQLVNRGTLRVTGPGPVTVGNNVLDNRGLIDVQSGTLHLAMAPGRMSQKPLGTLSVAAGSTVRSDAQLFLDGAVTGNGTIDGDLQVLNKLAPGSAAAPGKLTINGSLMLGAASTTHIKIASGTDYSSATSSGQLFVSGTLRTTSTAFTPAAQDRLEILGGALSTRVAGRFTAGRFPAPAGGRYLHVSYQGEHVLLEAGSNTAGFDLRDPPPAAVLTAWAAASPYRWVGYYLHSPCHSALLDGNPPASDATRAGHRRNLCGPANAVPPWLQGERHDRRKRDPRRRRSNRPNSGRRIPPADLDIPRR